MAEHKCEASRLKKGDRLSRTSYMEVVGIFGDMAHVKNEAGHEWSISLDLVSKECYTANQYDEEIKVTRTELIGIFEKIGDKICTANFNKQPKAEEVFDAIANKGKLMTNVEMRKALKKGMEGEPRTIICYSLGSETGMGRTKVIDLEADGNGIRQIDHRTLNWLIVGGKKYIEKNYKEPKAAK